MPWREMLRASYQAAKTRNEDGVWKTIVEGMLMMAGLDAPRVEACAPPLAPVLVPPPGLLTAVSAAQSQPLLVPHDRAGTLTKDLGLLQPMRDLGPVRPAALPFGFPASAASRTPDPHLLCDSSEGVPAGHTPWVQHASPVDR
jgi:hypothetical protein